MEAVSRFLGSGFILFIPHVKVPYKRLKCGLLTFFLSKKHLSSIHVCCICKKQRLFSWLISFNKVILHYISFTRCRHIIIKERLRYYLVLESRQFFLPKIISKNAHADVIYLLCLEQSIYRLAWAIVYYWVGQSRASVQ